MWARRDEVRTLSSLLRERGYCAFNGMKGGAYKTDYNFDPQDDPWDSTDSKELEWRNRKVGQPFFGQVNLCGDAMIPYALTRCRNRVITKD